MTSTDLIVLALLMEAPGHGYDLKKRLERLTAGTFALNDKLLYPALRRFGEEDLVTSQLQTEGSAPPRRVFAITDDGREAFYDALEAFSEADARNAHEFQVRFLLFKYLAPQMRLAIIARRQAALEQSLQRMVGGAIPAALSELAKRYGQRLVELAQRQTEAELAWLDEQRLMESS